MIGQAGQVGGEVLLGHLGPAAAEVEGVDEHVGVRVAAGHVGQVDAVDEAADLGHAGVVGRQVDRTLGGAAGEATGTAHVDERLVACRARVVEAPEAEPAHAA